MQPPQLPTQRFVTAASMDGRISYDGRSATSSAYLGGAAYVGQCYTCGLEPGADSKCICCCMTCGSFTNGQGSELRVCSKCSGVPWVPPVAIATVHVKPKPKRKRCTPAGTTTSGHGCGVVSGALLDPAIAPSSSPSDAVVVISSSSESMSSDAGGVGQPPKWMLRYMSASGAAQLRCPSGSDDDADPFAGLPPGP